MCVIPQNAIVGSAVGYPLNATQPGANVAVLFFITSGNTGNTFTLGVCNGQMRLLVSNLNYHVKNVYVLGVEARSNGLLTSATSANITINVINVPHVPVWNTSDCELTMNANSAYFLCLFLWMSIV